MPDLEKIKRSALAHFLDTTFGGDTPVYNRIRKSTSGATSLNPQVTTEQYIDEDSATSSIDGYQPSIDFPMVAYKGDPVFEALFPLYKARSIGAACDSTYIEVYIFNQTGTGQSAAYGAQKNNCTVEITSFGGDAGSPVSLEYTIHLNGDPIQGTATIANQVATFTAAA